jgi:hypothetical protein
MVWACSRRPAVQAFSVNCGSKPTGNISGAANRLCSDVALKPIRHVASLPVRIDIRSGNARWNHPALHMCVEAHARPSLRFSHASTLLPLHQRPTYRCSLILCSLVAMEHRSAHSRHIEPRPRLAMPIPDMRLESTFLRSISPYVHDGGGRIQWHLVAWVALRDSMLSPLVW